MANLSKLLSGEITKVTEKDLFGCTRITHACFAGCEKLESVQVPFGVVYVSPEAFMCCRNLKTVSLPASVKYVGCCVPQESGSYTQSYEYSRTFYGCDSDEFSVSDTCKNLQVGCHIVKGAFEKTNDYDNFYNSSEDAWVVGDGILLGLNSGITDIPSTVTTVPKAIYKDFPSTITTVVIPDSVQFMWGDFTGNTSYIKTAVVGAGVTKIEKGVMYNTNITTWVFRQPEGLSVELPASHLGYDKNSRTISVYTDNESITNYNWSGDNITANIYPLSSYTG